MNQYVTSIGLDVHARSISACAFDPMIGVVEQASFPHDPAAVAEWALSFDSPKAVYESGVTGFTSAAPWRRSASTRRRSRIQDAEA